MFLENKYTKWYFKIIEVAKTSNRKKRSGIYYESHHIIPKSMGGEEEVLLTAKEHYICHLLLCKMLTGVNRHKMINALIRMAFSKSKGQLRYTAKSYELVRKFIAEKNSEAYKGKSKSENMRKKLSESRKGIVFSESHKLNLSKAQKKRTDNGFRGKKHSDETKKLWSEKRKGKAPWNKGLKKKDYPNELAT